MKKILFVLALAAGSAFGSGWFSNVQYSTITKQYEKHISGSYFFGGDTTTWKVKISSTGEVTAVNFSGVVSTATWALDSDLLDGRNYDAFVDTFTSQSIKGYKSFYSETEFNNLTLTSGELNMNELNIVDAYLDNAFLATNFNANNKGITNIDWANSDDGSGSGLDADLLDGKNYDAFASTYNAVFSGNIAIGKINPVEKLQVSSSTLSGYSLGFAGAYNDLPTSGHEEGTMIYQVSDHTLYVATITVTNVGCWKAVW